VKYPAEWPYRSWRSVPLVTIVLGLVLLGCGGSEDEPRSAGATGQSASRFKPGAEASIEDFGSEAGGSTRRELLGSFHAYMGALADGHYRQACAGLSRTVIASLRQYRPEDGARAGCSVLLPALLAPAAAEMARRQNEGEVTRVRVGGGRAFVIYEAPGAELYDLALQREGSSWKSTTLLGNILVPSPVAFRP
jgi:hypothetical protein